MDPMVSKRRYTSWLLEVQQTVTLKTEKLSQKLLLKKAIVTPPGFMSTFSAMRGERNNNTGLPKVKVPKQKEESKPIDNNNFEDKLRQSGL
jgi:hypothetical protein